MPGYKHFLFFALLLFTGCISKTNVPPDVIERARMQRILVDIHLTDGSLDVVPAQPDSLFKYGSDSFMALLKKYGTDTMRFRKSFIWYSRHPVMMDSVYNNVIRVLQAKNDSLNKITPPGKRPAPANVVPPK